MNLLRRIQTRRTDSRRRRRYREIYERFQNFTMIPPSVYEQNLRLTESVRGLPGCVVECGVWRGGMIAGIATLLGPDRDYFLIDSFEGLPPAQAIDGKAAAEWQRDTASPTYYDNCAAPENVARDAMQKSGARSVQLVKGWYENTLPGFKAPSPIALLRLDADWYDSTMFCLENLFGQVANGGLIIIDDYFAWDGCSRAVHDFLSKTSAVERIRTHGEVCYLKRRSADA